MNFQKVNSRKAFFFFMIFALLFTWSACKKEEPIPIPDPGPEPELESGITAEELGSYEGAIGVKTSTRAISKKGYSPISVQFLVEAQLGDYDTTVPIDEFTNISQLKIEVEELTEEQADELRAGVPVQVKVFSGTNQLITSASFSVVSFKSSGSLMEIDAGDLDDLTIPPTFRSEVSHYLQLATADGQPTTKAAWVNYSSPNYEQQVLMDYNYDFDPLDSGIVKYTYTFHAIPNEPGVFAIVSEVEDKEFFLFMNGGYGGYLFQNNSLLLSSTNLSALPVDYKFRIERNSEGLYVISSYYSNQPLRLLSDSPGIQLTDGAEGEIAYFRILTADIIWDIEPLDTKFLPPILPAAETSFGFNSTLVNCGSGALEQTVGFEQSVTTATTVGWEESVSLSSSYSTTSSFTVGVSAEVEYFGSSVGVSAEASQSSTFTSGMASSSSAFSESTKEITQTFFSDRLVTVPPGKASLVYDAYQFYRNVKIPFVKRFRVRGDFSILGEALTGAEINTQFAFNYFNGLVTFIGSDYIEVTVRGVTTLDNIVKSESNVEDVPANCE